MRGLSGLLRRGGFKYFSIFTPKYGEMIQVDSYFSTGWLTHQLDEQFSNGRGFFSNTSLDHEWRCLRIRQEAKLKAFLGDCSVGQRVVTYYQKTRKKHAFFLVRVLKKMAGCCQEIEVIKLV